MPSTTWATVSQASTDASRDSKMSFQRITTIGSMPPANSEATPSRCRRSPSFSRRCISTRWGASSVPVRRQRSACAICSPAPATGQPVDDVVGDAVAFLLAYLQILCERGVLGIVDQQIAQQQPAPLDVASGLLDQAHQGAVHAAPQEAHPARILPRAAPRRAARARDLHAFFTSRSRDCNALDPRELRRSAPWPPFRRAWTFPLTPSMPASWRSGWRRAWCWPPAVEQTVPRHAGPAQR